MPVPNLTIIGESINDSVPSTHKFYEANDLASLKQTLGFEDERSRMLPAFTLDPAQRDFRLPQDHPAIAAGVYPQGHVPDCLLGVQGRN